MELASRMNAALFFFTTVPDSEKNKVAGDLEKEIADDKAPRSECIVPFAQDLQLVHHLQSGDGDVPSVDDVDEEQQQEIRDEPTPHLA